LDATIYSPDVDFRFRNDTDHYLLIQTETDLEAGTVTFQFYGTQTEREVIVSDPEITNEVEHDPPLYEQDASLPEGTIKQVEWAIDGMDVEVTRAVKEGNRIVHEDVITSHYRPWQAVYRVGPAE
jgi:vancomycin resistance protein YoaR